MLQLKNPVHPESVDTVLRLVVSGDIDKMRAKPAGALLAKSSADSALTEAGVREACGVGVVVTEADITACVTRHISPVRADLENLRYLFNALTLMKPIQSELQWADATLVKSILLSSVEGILGPKTSEDEAKIAEEKSKKSKKKGAKRGGILAEGKKKKDGGSVGSEKKKSEDGEEEAAVYFPRPEENAAGNTKEILKRHLEETGGVVVTRFPPEPNGYLHVGHAKAITLSYTYGAAGVTYLRYDDTNPETEEQEYIDAIAESVKWLGYTPTHVTHSSDYFDKLYELAEQLIATQFAYTCECSGGNDAGNAQGWGRVRVSVAIRGRQRQNVRSHAGGSLRRGRSVFATEGRHEARQPQHAGPRGVQNQVHAASANWRSLVRLSDVRLHALLGGLSRKHHALVVHRGV